MAVYTRLSNEEAAAFTERYAVGKFVKLVDIAGGIENTNYFLHTDGGVYLLTIYEARVNPAELPYFLDLMTHLKKNGLNCPLPVVAKNGKALQDLNGKKACLTTFLTGQSVLKPRTEHCLELGKAMAKMHLAGANYPAVRKNDLSVEGWEKLLAKIGKKADLIADGLYDELHYELDDIAARWPSGLPTGTIHADLFPDNVFFTEDKLSGIIDFYFACTDMFAYELAVCINAWCFEPRVWELNVTKSACLISGYNKVRPLSAAEKKVLPLLARGSALRFLLTRTFDWLNRPADALVTPKDPREYIQKLRFHHGIRSYFEYGFYG